VISFCKSFLFNLWLEGDTSINISLIWWIVLDVIGALRLGSISAAAIYTYDISLARVSWVSGHVFFKFLFNILIITFGNFSVYKGMVFEFFFCFCEQFKQSIVLVLWLEKWLREVVLANIETKTTLVIPFPHSSLNHHINYLLALASLLFKVIVLCCKKLVLLLNLVKSLLQIILLGLEFLKFLFCSSSFCRFFKEMMGHSLRGWTKKWILGRELYKGENNWWFWLQRTYWWRVHFWQRPGKQPWRLLCRGCGRPFVGCSGSKSARQSTSQTAPLSLLPWHLSQIVWVACIYLSYQGNIWKHGRSSLQIQTSFQW